MKLFVLLLILPLFDSLSMVAPTEEPYCYDMATAFMNKWMDAADIPTPALAKQIAEECKVPLECMERNEANNGTISYTEMGLLSLFGQICESFDAFAGPFGKCFEQLREKRSSPLVYKCAAYIGSMGYNITNCEFYKSGKNCAKTLLMDRCGEEVAGMLEEQSNVLIGQFVCANVTERTKMTTTGKPKTTTKEDKNVPGYFG